MDLENNCPLGERNYDLNIMSGSGSQPTSIKYQKIVSLLVIDHVTTFILKSESKR